MKKALKSATVANFKAFIVVDKGGLLSNHFMEDLRKIYALSDILPLQTLRCASFKSGSKVIIPTNYIPNYN